MTFIDQESCRCMLGKLSRNPIEKDGIFSWESRGTNHVVVIDNLNIQRLRELGSGNFHYFSEENLNELKKYFSVSSKKGKSVIIEIKNKNLFGKKNKKFRNYINKYKYLDIRNETSIKETDEMLRVWGLTLGEKYFRNMSGKNRYFIQNNFHRDCENVFIYDGEKLVSFGIASRVREGKCSYIVGKALSKEYPGLAEYTDLVLYFNIFDKYGSFSINLGQGEGGLLSYKMKFPGARIEYHYNGKYEM